jgi:hypothetical protein
MAPEKKERLVMAKELVDLFAAEGVSIGYRYARHIIKKCPQTVRGRYVKFSDAWTFWVLNPGFRPFGEGGDKGGQTFLAR